MTQRASAAQAEQTGFLVYFIAAEKVEAQPER